MRAAKTGDLAVMRLLLNKEANPALTQKNQVTALMLAAGVGWRSGNDVARDRARESDAVEAIKLCLERGLDIDAANANGQTALHGAVARGADAVVKYLAERGARLDVKDKQGLTPLDVALGNSGGRNGRPGTVHESTAALLRQLGATETPASP
jgi:ankyrin repeat protein